MTKKSWFEKLNGLINTGEEIYINWINAPVGVKEKSENLLTQAGYITDRPGYPQNEWKKVN